MWEGRPNGEIIDGVDDADGSEQDLVGSNNSDRVSSTRRDLGHGTAGAGSTLFITKDGLRGRGAKTILCTYL